MIFAARQGCRTESDSRMRRISRSAISGYASYSRAEIRRPFSSARTMPRNSSHAPCAPTEFGGEIFSAIGPRVSWISIFMRVLTAGHGRNQCDFVIVGKFRVGHGVFLVAGEPHASAMCGQFRKLFQQFRPKLFRI